MKRNLFFKILFLASITGAFSSYAGNNGKGGSQHFVLPSYIKADDYLPNKIILKVKEEYRGQLTQNVIGLSAVKAAFNELGISSMERMFPNASKPETEYNSWGAKMMDITIIYDLEYTSKVDLATAINKLIATNAFQYVEPWYVQHTDYNPNDPNLTNSGQYFMRTIKAAGTGTTAFDIQKGDPNVVIGIVDTGTDPLHPDLAPNIKRNSGETPGNGIDDDADGYIDNYSGWDVADNDSDATVGVQIHGVYVSGDADAATNNTTGVSSPGFNCKFLPVKSTMSTNSTTLDHTSAGIQYAADHGCAIINCSFGGAGFSQSQQDLITYATINKNCLVVASAGNNNTNVIQYPAAYQYVLNVAATTNTDAKASFSSYGTWVSISAPGNNIYSTSYVPSTKIHNYQSQSGTSMASPVTAGCAAIVKSQFPSYNPLQIAAQLKATADNIDAVNASFIGQLGTGRVNLYRALTETPKSVTMDSIVTTDGNDDAFVIGDTLSITGRIMNLLAPTANLTVTMSSASPYVSVLPASATLNLGAMSSMAINVNNANPFKAVIQPGTPLNSNVTFTFTFNDGSYTSTISYSVLINVDYINIMVNDISTTVTSKSWMAYNDPDLTTRLQGLGFWYRDSSFTYEIGFMAGTDATHVSDNLRQGGTGSLLSTDFNSTSNVKRIVPSPLGADFESTGIFNDASAASPLNILVHQRTYAWADPGERKYVIAQYIIKNTGVSPLSNLWAGVYSDWDVGAGGVPDLAAVDKTINLAYVWHNVPTGLYAGTKLLTHGPFNHYAIDNDSICPGVNVYVSYTKAEKYTALSTSKDNAGGCGANDVGHVVSTGPFTVNAGDSVTVAFALLAGDDLNDLKVTAGNAQIKYDALFPVGINELNQLASAFGMQSVVPNPSTGVTTFNFSLAKSAMTELSLYNEMGQKVCTLLNENMSAGSYRQTVDLSPYHLGAGIYFYRLQSGDKTDSGKLTIMN